MEESDTPRTDATQYQWTRTLDLSRDLERELSAVTRERNEWEFAARNEAKLAQVVVRERDEARAEVERLRSEIERAAIACSHGESQMARTILLTATEPKP